MTTDSDHEPSKQGDRTGITALTAVQLSQAIRSRAVSCVEVMTAYLSQIERFNPRVNAIVSLQRPDDLLAQAARRDVALAQALRTGDTVGWMHGFPHATKDLTSTAGMVTTQGSPLFASFVPDHDSILVERLRAAGAILIGKTNVPEFGLGSHTYNAVFGTTGNAFDPSKSAGGSSGGAAVALALNLLPVADGSDFMGSLRNPAGWNNVFGFRPSYGRVPSGPAADVFFQQFGIEGPMARTVADLGMLLSTIAGYDDRAPLSLAGDGAGFASPLPRDFARTRIGWLGDHDGYLPMEAGVLDTCERALGHFETIGCTVDAARVDFSMERLWRTWLVMRAFRVAGSLAATVVDRANRALVKPEARWEIAQGAKLTGAEIYQASVDRSTWYDALLRLFADFDFLVLPSAQVFPFDKTIAWPRSIAGRPMDTYHRWMEVVIGGTLAGLPVLCVPAGFGPAGLPIGLQIIGRPRADLDVLQVGYAYEQASGYGATRSPLLG
ncbi:MAG: amidase [Burkholderiaceae bacterium]